MMSRQIRKRWSRTAPVMILVLVWGTLACGASAFAGHPSQENIPEGNRLMQGGKSDFQNFRFAEAADLFAEAGKTLRGTWFADDAAFAYITALEAAGNDDQAAILWKKWAEDHDGSPLQTEATLANTWNLLRRGELPAARNNLDGLIAANPWLKRDGRARTLLAAMDYAEGQFESALTWLPKNPGVESVDSSGDLPDQQETNAPPLPALGLLLEGLCQEKLGAEYPAVIAFQNLLDEYPSSRLCGYAYLAKGRIFSLERDYRNAATEFEKLAAKIARPDIHSEARFLAAACHFLGGNTGEGISSMTTVAETYTGQDMAARALFALGEMHWLMQDYQLAITSFNKVLSGYFANDLAGSSLYRTGRCLDALDRTEEANGAYQAVANGYPYAPEAPAAVYLAGVGLLEQGHPLDAAPYFQLVLDRYAGSGATFVFESPQHQELVEASLCLLEYSYHQSNQLGRMSGAPHLALQKMPPSNSLWRAYSLLLDADALAAQARFPEAQASLDLLLTEFPDHRVGIRANRLLAWTYARQGRQDLAIETEKRMLARYSAQQDDENLSATRLTMAHSMFNTKDYQAAADAYTEFLGKYPLHTEFQTALFQQGLCFQRLGRDGDAVDAWERITHQDPTSPTAEKAWLRTGNAYFQAGHFPEARECFVALMENFPTDQAQATALLRLGRCDYNEGLGTQALARFRELRAQYPESPESREAVQDLTQVLFGLGQDGDDACFEELARDFPANPLAPEARMELAVKQYDAEDFIGAGLLFTELAGRYPSYSGADRASFLAADCREKSGDSEEALQNWMRFLDYFPTSELGPTARFRVASLHFQDGRYIQAGEDFQAVLKTEAEDEIHSASLFNLALCRRILGDGEGAGRALEEYRTRDFPAQKRDIQVARVLGEIHEETGRFGSAAAEYHRAIELGAEGTETVELNYLAGVCLDKAGDREGALGSYEQSIAYSEKSNTFRLSALAQTAALQEEGGDYRQALANYKDLIENAADPALLGAAQERATQLETALGL
ncbi:MAG: tetratricopeptide repeat protein [Gemmatimonadales bacterium]|nr:tetratricopeptide repeat protein [Gemmatimonadales bacterium]